MNRLSGDGGARSERAGRQWRPTARAASESLAKFGAVAGDGVGGKAGAPAVVEATFANLIMSAARGPKSAIQVCTRRGGLRACPVEGGLTPPPPAQEKLGRMAKLRDRRKERVRRRRTKGAMDPDAARRRARRRERLVEVQRLIAAHKVRRGVERGGGGGGGGHRLSGRLSS